MIGKSHIKISHLMLQYLNPSLSCILNRFIDTFEDGVFVPDKHIMWHCDPAEPAENKNPPKHLVHRYYIDIDDSFDRKGRLLEMIWMYTDGIISFVQDGAEVSSAYPTIDNLVENWVLYVGMLTHFLGDICTPLHVGICQDNHFKEIAGKKYHSKIEQALWNYHKNHNINDIDIMKCNLNTKQLTEIAQKTYEDYLLLVNLYPLQPETKNDFRDLSERLLERSVSFSVGWINSMIAKNELELNLKEAMEKLNILS